MYFEYLKEKENLDHYLTDEFFFTYKIKNDLFFISDLYIKPEYRKTLTSYKVFKTVKRLVKENNCRIIEITMETTDHFYEKNLIIYYRLGFRIIGKVGSVNYLRMVHNG